jgi:hypothetical protein
MVDRLAKGDRPLLLTFLAIPLDPGVSRLCRLRPSV